MTLKDLKPGQSGVVVNIEETGVLRRRIMDMGITKGVQVQVVKMAPLGDPIQIYLRGYGLSLRKEEAKRIVIEKLA